MLITVVANDKAQHMYKSFKQIWSECTVECQICFDRIHDEGVVAVTQCCTINIEKMFHAECLKRWHRENNRDPFNRNVRYWYTFPPRSLVECASLLEKIKNFIGDQEADKKFHDEYNRLQNAKYLDIDLNFDKLLRY